MSHGHPTHVLTHNISYGTLYYAVSYRGSLLLLHKDIKSGKCAADYAARRYIYQALVSELCAVLRKLVLLLPGYFQQFFYRHLFFLDYKRQIPPVFGHRMREEGIESETFFFKYVRRED